ncbi:glycosyltransferase [Mucilaginibacter ginkgonis]|uniref:Glycosyltransferase n=1 Tax=Mucilaginibacter ginkgonis TaxID=2682091 RepID=A0A7T7FBA1_9SPHI|nr:glycosyltransferase [Mucilaginibacter ginkgonis]QQL50196.1 glycosyltransferase [Mucilaginibacter ginkgonis]
MVSVIIPNYNHADFLRQRINSVVSQTYLDIEVIVLDDASVDGSREIIEEYRRNPKIRNIIYNDANSGSTFKQWENGVSLSNGQYIWIAESDDYCKENFLEEAVMHLKSANTTLHYCESQLVDERGDVLEQSLEWPKAITTIDWKSSFKMSGSAFIKMALRYRNVIPNASAVVFKKCVFDFAGLEKYKSTGDWLFWIRILLKGDISFSPQILNSFRSHKNTTRGVTERHKILLRFFEEVSVRYELCSVYHVGDNAELQRFLNATIDVCHLFDLVRFAKFCSKFNLPYWFLLKFLKRKILK